ncbi:fatty acid desaturase-domain-containing protein [Stachybotrys elegans]|uniref:Fatty acid desaturase-domain-containing protein n=1 Tax=Stachybotrys elegans TaxID=80388 RepID=A0A8K0SG37_9HYPO|nr:fatty acid desaturase-domain-containing protein [Stachybotrys elegans]
MPPKAAQSSAVQHMDGRLSEGLDAAQAPKHLDLDGNVYELPDFTIKQIREAIPPHCFQPSAVRGLLYTLRDYLYLGTMAYTTYYFVPLIPYSFLRALCYGVYSMVAGMVMTGIWIIAHECGHGAFSKSKTLNDSVGFILHSFLLVPYFSWRISHSHHHRATGDMQRDTVFIPHTKESWVKQNLGPDIDPLTVESISEDAPIRILWRCLLHQLFAWPMFMLDNLGGQEGKRGFPIHSHYWFGKKSAIFKEQELQSVFASDLGVLAMIVILYLGVQTFGWPTVILFYGIPYLWLNHWIVLITFLQHTDGRLPHFSRNKWTFLRGATATIDRDFGFIDTHLFHHIVGTHVLHHLVSSIPFYHAQEATEAIKRVMGKHYHEDRHTNLLSAFWKNQRDCEFVEESAGMEGSGIYMFRNLRRKN